MSEKEEGKGGVEEMEKQGAANIDHQHSQDEARRRRRSFLSENQKKSI